MKEKIKEKLKKLFENGTGALILLFVLEIILIMFVTPIYMMMLGL